LEANENKIAEDLNNHPEILAEAYQTILRRENVDFPYEKLKQLTRGKNVSLKDLQDFIDNINVSDKVKQELKTLSPENYLGLASKLAQCS
jgi:adenylosuccinate lyase